MIASAVVSRGGNQYLTVNGQLSESLAYITYLPENGKYEDFAAAGYKLYSVCAYFGSNKLNELSGLDLFYKGIFDEDVPDFSDFDAHIGRVLAACPDGLIFPRVNVSLSRIWDETHPEELCFEGIVTHPDRKRPCYASDIWAQEVKRQLALFIAHVENAPYRDHIIGYQIAGGNTEEWFSYNDKGGDGKRAREKFAASGETETPERYWRYLSELTADRICEFAGYIKELTDRRLVVGTFYGYTLEKYNRGGSHHGLGRMLRCPDVDFICSPISYSQVRAAGRDHPYMLPLHSLKYHGKLYFSENDTRTHLSRAVNDNPHYNKPIWFGPDRDATLNILKMHLARSLINGHAAWWFDMWGGWFADEAYMAFMKKARSLQQNAWEKPAQSVTEVAVLCDETAPAGLDDKDKGLRNVFFDIREALGKAAVPYHIYLTSDFEAIKNRYKAFVLLEPRQTADSVYIRDSVKNLLTITPENSDITTDQLRVFYKNCGVWVYSETDMVVYADSRYVFLHTATEGEQHLRLPEQTVLADVFQNKIFDTDFVSPVGKSFLLEKSQ